MEQQQPNSQGSSLFQLNLDAANGYTLRSAASWGKVLGVVSLILGILFIAMGILAQSAMRSGGRLYGDEFRGNSELAANIGLVTYVIMGLIMVIGGLFSLNFGNKISSALKANDQNALSSGFAACRNFFAFWAILCIIFLLLVIISVASLATAS